MKFLDTISTALAGKGKSQPNAARLAELVAEAEAGTVAARARLTELEGQRAEKALSGESERLAFRAELASVRDDIAEGGAAIEALRGRHATALAAEVEDKRQKAHGAAQARAAELVGLISAYEGHAKTLRDTIRKIAEIDVAVMAANSDLPDGAAAIPDSGALRSIAGAARETVSEKIVELWCSSGSTDPLASQDHVSDSGKGRGTLRTSNGTTPMDCVRRRFVQREIRAAVRTVHATGFGDIRLPAARAGQEDIFSPRTELRQPRDILAAVDARIAAEAAQRPTSTSRPVVIEHTWMRDPAS